MTDDAWINSGWVGSGENDLFTLGWVGSTTLTINEIISPIAVDLIYHIPNIDLSN